MSSYKHVIKSRFAENAVFKQQQLLNQATCYHLEHGFGKIVLTAFHISATFCCSTFIACVMGSQSLTFGKFRCFFDGLAEFSKRTERSERRSLTIVHIQCTLMTEPINFRTLSRSLHTHLFDVENCFLLYECLFSSMYFYLDEYSKYLKRCELRVARQRYSCTQALTYNGTCARYGVSSAPQHCTTIMTVSALP